MCSVDTSDFLQELWAKYLKCSYKNKSDNLLAFLRSLYYSSIKGRNQFQSALFTNDVSGMIRLLIRELLNDLENVCISNDDGEKGANDVRNLREYLEGERGTMVLYGIDVMLEQIVSVKDNKVQSIKASVIKILNDAELSNILATSLISLLNLLENDGFVKDVISEMIVLPDSSLSQNFYEQLHRSSISKKTPSHRPSVIQCDVSSDENSTNKPRRKRKPFRLTNKPLKSEANKKSGQSVKMYVFDQQSGPEIADLYDSDLNNINTEDPKVPDGSLQCGNVLITLRIITRLLGHMIVCDPSLCTNSISIHLELFTTCCHFLGDHHNIEQLERLAHEILHNIGVTIRIMFVERTNDQSSVSMLLGHKVIDRILLAHQFLAKEQSMYSSLIGDLNKLIVYIFIIVSKKVLATGNHTLRGIIQLFTSWHLNDGLDIAQNALNDETSNPETLVTTDKSRSTLFSQLCTLLSLLNEFALEGGVNSLENRPREIFSHHSDKFNLVPTVNRKDTVETCCYAMICELLLNNLIFLLTKDSNSIIIGTAKKRVYHQILVYIKSTRFCCSIDIFSYSSQLLRLLVSQKSNTVKTVILRFLQILLEISFEFYKSRDRCVCQYTSRHDISLILRDISNACLPISRNSVCPRQFYSATPADLLHFFDWLARSHDDGMKTLVIDVVVHPILSRLQGYYSDNLSQQYHLIGAAVLSLMPYLNSPWEDEDLVLINNVCRKNPILHSTLYKCLTLVVLSTNDTSSPTLSEREIKSRIIVFLLSNFNFESQMQLFNKDEFRANDLIKDLLENVYIWQCYRTLFSYNEEFRRALFIRGGIDCCYLILKEIIKHISSMSTEVNDDTNKSVFFLFESMLCLVVDGNILKSAYFYEGFSCDIIWTQLQNAILLNFPTHNFIAKLLMNSILHCCFRTKWSIQDSLYQLRQVFLNSIVNMSSSIVESDLDSDTGDFDVCRTSIQNESDSETDIDDYDADVSSGVTSFDDNSFLEAKINEFLFPSIQRSAVFMNLFNADGTSIQLDINCVLVQILLRVTLASPVNSMTDVFKETLEILYNNVKLLPDRSQRQLISDELIEEMSTNITIIFAKEQSADALLILLKLLILPSSSWCTSTRLRFLIEMSKKNQNLTEDILQMLIDKAFLIRTFQPEVSVKFPIDMNAIIEKEVPASNSMIDGDAHFDYLVYSHLTDQHWKSLDSESTIATGGFSVSMWLQMDLSISSNERKRNGDYKRNIKRHPKSTKTSTKTVSNENDISAMDVSDQYELVHLISFCSRDKLDHRTIISVQIWCKPSFGTVVIRLYECTEIQRTPITPQKTGSKFSVFQQLSTRFGPSSTGDNSGYESQYLSIEQSPSNKLTLVDEAVIHGLVTSHSWQFLTVTVNWRSVESAMVTFLLNGDVMRQSKLLHSPSRVMRVHSSVDSYIGIGHVYKSSHTGCRQHYSLGRIFLFDSPIIACGNDNLALMLMTPDWDGGQIISSQRDDTKTLAAVVMTLLVDLQKTTEAAALLLERGQNILSNGWLARMVEYISNNLVGTYSSEDPYQFVINSSYIGASSFITNQIPSTRFSLKEESEPTIYPVLGSESFIVVKSTMDSALERLGGIPVLIFWLAKFVEGTDEKSSRLLLRLFLILLRKSVFLSFQNRKESGYSLLFQLFKSFRMNINLDMIMDVLDHTIYECPVQAKSTPKRNSSSKLCRDPLLLRDLLLQWKMWSTSKAVASDNCSKTDLCQSVEIDKYLLSQISSLLNEDNIYSNINCGSLGVAGILSPLLLACQEPFDTLPAPLPSEICKLIVQIINNFIPTPSDLDTVTDLCNTILHLYQVSTKDSDFEQGKYFRLIKSFMNSEWESPNNNCGPKFLGHLKNVCDGPVHQEELSPRSDPSDDNLTTLENGRISMAEIQVLQTFYSSTLSQNFVVIEDSEPPQRDIEKSGDSVGSNSSNHMTLINDDDDVSIMAGSFEDTYLSSTSMEDALIDKNDSVSPNSSSRIDTLVGLISTLENVIQVKISDSILVQLSMANFCFEFIIHLLTHHSALVRHRGLSLFRVYIGQKKFLTQSFSQQPQMLNIVAYLVHQNVATADIVAETVSIVFSQNMTSLITDIDWENGTLDIESVDKNGKGEDSLLTQLPHIDSRSKLSGMVSSIQEQTDNYTSFEDMILRAGNHFGMPYSRSCVLLLSTLANIENASLTSMLRFCDWLFIQNPPLLQASIKSGLLECVCNLCHQMSMTNVPHGSAPFQALLDICETIATDLTAIAPDSQFVRLLELCDILYFAALKMAKKIIDKGSQFVLQQYVIQTIIGTTIETISFLNSGDPLAKINISSEQLQQKIERLPRKFMTHGSSLSQKLIKTIRTSTHMIINTQEYLFPMFFDLFKYLGQKLVDYISKIISTCLSCNIIPDHFSVYLCAKEVIKTHLGDLVIFLTNHVLDISLRLSLMSNLLQLDNIDRVTRYSLLGNSSGSICLILNLNRMVRDLQETRQSNDTLIASISSLLRVIRLDFNVEILREDNRNLWIQDCAQKLKTWKQNFNETINSWNKNAERSENEVILNIKKYQSSYRPHARKSLQKQYIDNIKKQRSLEFYRRRTWKTLIANFTQERAIWSCDENETQFMQLDPTEGPSRVRRRMVKTTLNLDKRFFTTDLKQCQEHTSHGSLDYLFDSTYSMDRMVFESPIKYQLLRCIETSRLVCPCVWVCQSGTFDGEFFVGPNRIGFMVDNVNSSRSSYDQLPNQLKDYGFVNWKLNEINWVLKRRFKLRDLALEIFMKDGRNCLIAASTTQERDAVANCIESFLPPSVSTRPRLIEIQHQWVTGEMTNFDYLTVLNTASGRSYNDVMQYPVFPFILTNYTSDTLNLHDDATFRDLSNPIAVQNPILREKVALSFAEKAEVYQTQLKIATSGDDMDNMPIWALPPHHYSSLYSNSGTVLYYMIRVPPFTQKFIEFQDHQFDRPDRMFHTLESAWDLSTSSMSCVKEIIPEFFYLPEMFVNNQSFNFGERHSGVRVDDVILPKWCNGDARLFCLIHRAALESPRVSATINMWIDLIFGFKQTGKAALDAMNLFHPYTYYKAICPDEIFETIRRKAVEQMIENYGQIPKQLFLNRPHATKRHSQKDTKKRRITISQSSISLDKQSSSSSEHIESTYLQKDRGSISVLGNIVGIPWGDWVGSPQHGQTFINTLSSVNYPDARSIYVIPKSKYNKKFHKVLILPHYSDALCLSNVDEDNLPIMRFSANSKKRRIKVSSMFLGNQDTVTDNHGSFFVSIGSGTATVTSMVVYQRSGRIFFGMDSGLIQVYQGDINKYSNIPSFLENFGKYWRTLSGHSSPVTHMVVGESFAVLASCDQRANVAIWDSQRLDLMHYIDWTTVKSPLILERLSFVNNDFSELSEVHASVVTAMCFSNTLGDLVIACTMSRKASNWQLVSNVSLFTINGKHVQSILLPGTVVSLSYTNLPEGRNVNAIAVATNEGRLTILSSWDLQVVWKIQIPVKNVTDPVLDIQYSHSGKELFVLHKSGHVKVIHSNKTRPTLKQSVFVWL